MANGSLTTFADAVDPFKVGTHSGLNFAYGVGRLRHGATLVNVVAGTVALTDATVNYVEVSSSGVVSKNTVGFTAGAIPLYQVTTAGGAITTVVDARAFLSTGATPTTGAEALHAVASDETTAITTTGQKVSFRMPFAMTVTAVRASLGTACTTGTFTVDINEAGVSILSTKLTFDATEKTTVTAAVPPVISDTALADDAEITIDVDNVGDSLAKGLKVWIIGTRA